MIHLINFNVKIDSLPKVFRRTILIISLEIVNFIGGLMN